MKNVGKTLLAVFALGAILLVGSVSCSDDDAPEGFVIQNPSNSNTILVDETLHLGVTLESGAPVEEEVVWVSSDETIAAVDRVTGLIRGVARGQVRIICTTRRVARRAQNRRVEIIIQVVEASQNPAALEAEASTRDSY